MDSQSVNISNKITCSLNNAIAGTHCNYSTYIILLYKATGYPLYLHGTYVTTCINDEFDVRYTSAGTGIRTYVTTEYHNTYICIIIFFFTIMYSNYVVYLCDHLPNLCDLSFCASKKKIINTVRAGDNSSPFT